MNEDTSEGSGESAIAERVKPAPPKRYAVILLNDDYTTQEFVVEVLKRFFAKNDSQAQAIMLQVHHQGRGVAGIYSFEIAETKSVMVNEYARGKGYPLKTVVEPE